MPEEKKKKPAPAPLVEDATVSGGTDKNGAPVIKPKAPDRHADESMDPTDPREKK